MWNTVPELLIQNICTALIIRWLYVEVVCKNVPSPVLLFYVFFLVVFKWVKTDLEGEQSHSHSQKQINPPTETTNMSSTNTGLAVSVGISRYFNPQYQYRKRLVGASLIMRRQMWSIICMIREWILKVFSGDHWLKHTKKH